MGRKTEKEDGDEVYWAEEQKKKVRFTGQENRKRRRGLLGRRTEKKKG